VNREESAYHDFLYGAKILTNFKLLPQATEHYRSRTLALAKHPDTPEEVGALMADDLAYQTFAWFEYNVQRMKYEGPRGLVHEVRSHPAEFLKEFELPPGRRLGTLELDPRLAMPDYYRDTDFHLQPGGVWPDDLAACIYEQVALTVFPGLNEKQQIHHVFTQGLPRTDYGRILDVGCGYVKSLTPFAERYPSAELYGVDLSGPVLKLGYQKAESRGQRMMLSQQNGEHTNFADGMFDLVTATMVIHEIPPPNLANLFREAYRVTAPGGDVIFLDFYGTGNPWRDYIMDGHSQRNNEPFLKMLFRVDLVQLAHQVGFSEVEVVPFDERTGEVRKKMRPEWHFPWAVVKLRK